MYKFYYYGEKGDDFGYNKHEFATLEEIYEIIEANSWYEDYMDGKIKRTCFTPIRITKITETSIISENSPVFSKFIDSGKIKFEEQLDKKKKEGAEKQRKNELKLLEELKKKYESSLNTTGGQ